MNQPILHHSQSWIVFTYVSFVAALAMVVGGISRDLALSQPGKRCLGLHERPIENRRALDAAAAGDPDRFCCAGDPPSAFEL